MGRCPNCGYQKLLLDTRKCLYCGKKCCTNCARYVLTVGVADMWACSEECVRRFEQKVLEYPLQKIGADVDAQFYSVENQLWHEACIATLDRNDEWVKGWINLYKSNKDYALDAVKIKTQSSDGLRESDLRARFRTRTLLTVANNMEAVGRPLDAANVYEKNLKMYDKARELREGQKQVVVKRMEISVNLNELLQQVKDGGIVADYRCPHCGGSLRIGSDTNLKSLKVCKYCGSEIETMDLADFLKTLLS